MTDEFFEEKQAGAVLKHGILHRYLHIFASKTGSTAPEGRVYYLDGYAGPGVYGDGQPGSPAFATNTAEKLAAIRKLHGIYIEKDADACASLKQLLEEKGHEHTILNGTVEDQLDTALTVIGEKAPLFAFFDPFGVPLPMDELRKVLRGRTAIGGPAVEILINFMYSGMRRTLGHLTSTSTDPTYLKSRETIISNMNRVLDGDWWQDLWRNSAGKSGEIRCQEIAHGYAERLVSGLQSWGWRRISVEQKWNGKTTYELIFITLFPKEGLYHIAECASSAYDDYRAFCREKGEPVSEDKAYNDLLIEDAKRNIKKLIAGGTSFRLITKHHEIRESESGLMRGKHIRAAIKALYKEGVLKTEGKGDLEDLLIEPA